MGGISIACVLVAIVSWPAPATAQNAVPAPAAPQTAVPAPSWARSIEVVSDGAPAMLAPSPDARRRGTIGAGTRLGFSRRVFGKGCSMGVWYETADGLFICEEHVRASTAPPGPKVEPVIEGARLPQRYAFIRVDGTRAYAHPSDYFANDYIEAFGRGFGIVITGEQAYGGVEFVRTRRHLWVERDSVRFVTGSPFKGVAFEPGAPLDVAWVARRPANVHEKPHGRIERRLERHVRVRIERIKGGWAKLREGGWMKNSDLARPKLVPPPEGVGDHDRWIDVDVAQQVLVAYQGTQPRFATLVSSGRDSKASETPIGVFELWVKLDYTDMDDIERTDIARNYSIQDVPWVQFFKGSYGFHAAFWHNDFGRRRSHGCINLSPADARYLFQFTEPVLPAGWNAILPIPEDRPTVVQVR